MDAPSTHALRDQFIQGMSHAACTVNIVTTDGPAGRGGITVSAMSSVSADTPRPTLLVCVHHRSPVAETILKNGVFCVNVLKDDQAYISDTFAGRYKDQIADKFDCAEWQVMQTGAPRVIDPLVGFDCRVVSSELVGTHYVFFGEVVDLFLAGHGYPLIYANRAYGSAWRIEAAKSIAAGKEADGRTLKVGCFHTFGPFILPEMLGRMAETGGDLKVDLVEGDQRRVQESLLAGETEVALLYDLDLSLELKTEVLTHLQPYVLLPEGHALAAKSLIEPRDLADHPMVLLNAQPSRTYFQRILTDAGITPRVAFRSQSLEMVRGMVGHGLGYSILAAKPAAPMTYDGKALITRPLVSDTEPSRIVLAVRKDMKLSKATEQFTWFCRDFFDLDA
ncbi:MAG: hypothetical protein GY952_09410 [Rhodobacteraceae bacterium]|nr:hypothetical protein [Paracoccaceae bacterium]